MTSPAQPSTDWPPHAHETRPWVQAFRAGSREDRTLTRIDVSLPPKIAGAALLIPPRLAADADLALARIVALDARHGDRLAGLGALLLRTESVASSRIEQLDATAADYGRALYGGRANTSATAMVAAADATSGLLSEVSSSGRIGLADLLAAHRTLMRDDPGERSYAGKLRDVQNWIGGSDHSPLGALYIPPPPETVPDYMRDLIAFCSRDDLPVLAQATIAHAQFESIHPFTDGNGRIGRALINAILRRRGATSRVVVPLASALLARRDGYFDALNSYRAGGTLPLQALVIRGALVTAQEAEDTAGRLAALSEDWDRRLGGRPRAHSAAAKLLAVLGGQPVITATTAVDLVGSNPSSIHAAIAELHAAGILAPLTDRKRDQVWGASQVLDELEALNAQIRQAMTSTSASSDL